jgi:hypothetical protein
LLAIDDSTREVPFPGEKGGNDIACNVIVICDEYSEILFIHRSLIHP